MTPFPLPGNAASAVLRARRRCTRALCATIAAIGKSAQRGQDIQGATSRGGTVLQGCGFHERQQRDDDHTCAVGCGSSRVGSELACPSRLEVVVYTHSWHHVDYTHHLMPPRSIGMSPFARTLVAHRMTAHAILRCTSRNLLQPLPLRRPRSAHTLAAWTVSSRIRVDRTVLTFYGGWHPEPVDIVCAHMRHATCNMQHVPDDM